MSCASQEAGVRPENAPLPCPCGWRQERLAEGRTLCHRCGRAGFSNGLDVGEGEVWKLGGPRHDVPTLNGPSDRARYRRELEVESLGTAEDWCA